MSVCSHGGIVLMTFLSGIVDENEDVGLGGYPAPFRKLLGLWIEEFAPYGSADANQVQTDIGYRFACNYWSDIIRLEGAKVFAYYLKDYYAGYPAATRYVYGKGTSYYLGTSLEPTGLSWLVDSVLKESEIEPLEKSPAGVEITRRSDGNQTWTFILNYSDDTVRVELQSGGLDLITGAMTTRTVQLGPKAVAIIQT